MESKGKGLYKLQGSLEQTGKSFSFGLRAHLHFFSPRTLVFASYLFTWNNHHSSRIIPHHFTLYYVCMFMGAFLKGQSFLLQPYQHFVWIAFFWNPMYGVSDFMQMHVICHGDQCQATFCP